MLERVLELRVDLAAVTDGPNSPRRLAIEQQIAEIEDAMSVERQRLADATAKPHGSLYEELRLEVAMTEALLAGLSAAQEAAEFRIAEAETRFAVILAASSASDEAAVDLARLISRFPWLVRILAVAQLHAANATPALVVVEQAIPPVRPSFPLPVLNAIVAALCGIVFGTYSRTLRCSVRAKSQATQLGGSRGAALQPRRTPAAQAIVWRKN